MPTNLTLSRDIPLRQPVDVLVAGGGPAGVAAAVTAAMASAVDTRSIPVAGLQAKLRAMGAFLPNFTAPDAG